MASIRYIFDTGNLKYINMKPEDMTPEQKKMMYVQDTLYVINGKWRIPILIAMYHGNNRFRDIQRAVLNITTRVLSKELKELEANKLITRTDTSPVLIEYKVSPYSETIHPLVAEMEKWGQYHREKIKEK